MKVISHTLRGDTRVMVFFRVARQDMYELCSPRILLDIKI